MDDHSFLGRDEGITKVMIFDEHTDQILGVAIVGPNAGDLIAEGALAIEWLVTLLISDQLFTLIQHSQKPLHGCRSF